MFTSGRKREPLAQGILSLLISLGLTIFGFIYLACSHGMFSLSMHLCFVPFLCSGGIWMLLSFVKKDFVKDVWFHCIWNAGVVTLTVGLIMRGILVIYGTSCDYLSAYWYVGGVLLVCAVARVLYSIFLWKKT